METLSLNNFIIDPKSSAAQQEVKKLKETLLGEGFFLLVEHGIENSIIDKAYEQSEIFHNLDDDDPRKQATHYRHSHFGRGWSPCGEAPAYSAGTNATCSAFDMCYEIAEVDTEHENYGPNLWPLEMQEYQEAVYDYYLKFSELEQKVAIAIEEALGLDKEQIASKMTEKSPSTMRLIFYPPVKEKPEDNLFGISAHTDYEVFTLLTQSQPGSQLQKHSGDWHTVESNRYQVIVMIGDMLEVMTNGQVRATPHRVPPVSWARYSITRFCAIDGHYVIEPLEQFIDPKKGPLYEPVSQQKNIKDGLEQAAANSEAMVQEIRGLQKISK
ncbi:MAG: hypothetical protein MK218_07750 [Gammaproteobacteria bacterium]|nr:hypothetical protein [Gammaproteobacteria bacterium]